ncbi:hypothetical protein AAC387_Pa02g1284 [Persea americana]
MAVILNGLDFADGFIIDASDLRVQSFVLVAVRPQLASCNLPYFKWLPRRRVSSRITGECHVASNSHIPSPRTFSPKDDFTHPNRSMLPSKWRTSRSFQSPPSLSAHVFR